MTIVQWKKKFAKRLSRRMEQLGLSQNRLAKLSGVSQASICRYLKAKQLPSAVVIRKLCKTLSMTQAELVEFN